MRHFHPGAIQPEHLAYVADDVADGLVFECFRQCYLYPFLQVQVVDIVDLYLPPARPDMNLCLVGVTPIAGLGNNAELGRALLAGDTPGHEWVICAGPLLVGSEQGLSFVRELVGL